MIVSYEGLYTFIIIPRSVLLRIRKFGGNVQRKPEHKCYDPKILFLINVYYKTTHAQISTVHLY
jgi:hypothetical protein